MNNPPSPTPTERAYKAARLRFAVGYLAKHAKGLNFTDWNKISNDILDAANLLDRIPDPVGADAYAEISKSGKVLSVRTDKSVHCTEPLYRKDKL